MLALIHLIKKAIFILSNETWGWNGAYSKRR
jgi:hypothetical protein